MAVTNDLTAESAGEGGGPFYTVKVQILMEDIVAGKVLNGAELLCIVNVEPVAFLILDVDTLRLHPPGLQRLRRRGPLLPERRTSAAEG